MCRDVLHEPERYYIGRFCCNKSVVMVAYALSQVFSYTSEETRFAISESSPLQREVDQNGQMRH